MASDSKPERPCYIGVLHLSEVWMHLRRLAAVLVIKVIETNC